jgi:hypothetical protein
MQAKQIAPIYRFHPAASQSESDMPSVTGMQSTPYIQGRVHAFAPHLQLQSMLLEHDPHTEVRRTIHVNGTEPRHECGNRSCGFHGQEPFSHDE